MREGNVKLFDWLRHAPVFFIGAAAGAFIDYLLGWTNLDEVIYLTIGVGLFFTTFWYLLNRVNMASNTSLAAWDRYRAKEEELEEVPCDAVDAEGHRCVNKKDHLVIGADKIEQGAQYKNHEFMFWVYKETPLNEVPCDYVFRGYNCTLHQDHIAQGLPHKVQSLKTTRLPAKREELIEVT